MIPNTVGYCLKILRAVESLPGYEFQIQGERERGSVFHVVAVKTSSRSNGMSRQR